MSGKQNHWVRARFYTPFIMGGDVWQERRFSVLASTVDLPKKLSGVIARNPHDKHWTVYESTTGGCLGVGKTKKEAIADASNNVEITPDLKKQIANMVGLMNLPEMDATEAQRRLARTE